MNLAKSLQQNGVGAILIHSLTAVEKFEELLLNVDNVVFQRCFDGQGNVGAFFELAKKKKKKCIYEIDDLVLPAFVETIGSVKGGQWNIDEAMKIATFYEDEIKKMDSCIVSTPLLKTHIEERIV